MIDGIPTAGRPKPLPASARFGAAEAEDFQSRRQARLSALSGLPCPDFSITRRSHPIALPRSMPIYLRHENHPEDPAYRRVPSPVCRPAAQRLVAPGSQEPRHYGPDGPGHRALGRDAAGGGPFEVALH